MDMIINEKLKVRIIIQGRVDSADYELYRKLRKAGVFLIAFGIESANQDVLDFYNKRTNPEVIRTAVSLANKVGILTFGWLMIGAPMETREYFERDLKFVNDIKLDLTYVCTLKYVKGTSLWDDARKKGLIKDDKPDFDNKELSPVTRKELRVIREGLVKSFYKNPKRIARIFLKFIRLGLFSLAVNSLKMNQSEGFWTFLYGDVYNKSRG